MILQTGGAQGDFLNIYLDFNDVADIEKSMPRILEYLRTTTTPFTEYWSPRFPHLSSDPGAEGQPVEPLLSWQDEAEPEHQGERGTPHMLSRPIQPSKIDALRSLVEELQAGDHWSGWVDRARDVGCHKELLCIQQTGQGPRLVVYREGNGADLERRLAEYGKTDSPFSQWWYPRWNALVEEGESSSTERFEILLDWTDEQWRPG